MANFYRGRCNHSIAAVSSSGAKTDTHRFGLRTWGQNAPRSKAPSALASLLRFFRRGPNGIEFQYLATAVAGKSPARDIKDRCFFDGAGVGASQLHGNVPGSRIENDPRYFKTRRKFHLCHLEVCGNLHMGLSLLRRSKLDTDRRV